MDKHILIRMSDILADIANTNLKDIGELLDYYNRDTTTINGIMYYSFNDPCVAARLNARYYELVGEDHPRFMEQAPIVIDKLMKDKNNLLKTGAYSSLYFDKLERIKNDITKKNKKLEIVEGHHPKQDLSTVVDHLDSVSIEEVRQQLDYYNGDATMVNGIMYYSFNDPCVAARLNARYYELVGENHPRFMEQAPIVIDKLMKDKNKLLKAGAYSPLYFDKLKQIKKTIIDSLPSKQSVKYYHNKNKEVLVTSSQKDDIGNASSDKELHQMFEDSYVNNITRKISK